MGKRAGGHANFDRGPVSAKDGATFFSILDGFSVFREHRAFPSSHVPVDEVFWFIQVRPLTLGLYEAIYTDQLGRTLFLPRGTIATTAVRGRGGRLTRAPEPAMTERTAGQTPAVSTLCRNTMDPLPISRTADDGINMTRIGERPPALAPAHPPEPLQPTSSRARTGRPWKLLLP